MKWFKSLIEKEVNKRMNLWVDKLDRDLIHFKTTYNNHYKELSQKQDAHFQSMRAHSEQVERYLKGFNEILDRKL